ncbi:MAG: right-handed parallel beta-helix repeat-containing protein [Gammaproteobacteria bacterium]|nr:right-handed parallel beta-helix repeat-containing protein [Gammaproteobacteria bacterium]
MKPFVLVTVIAVTSILAGYFWGSHQTDPSLVLPNQVEQGVDYDQASLEGVLRAALPPNPDGTVWQVREGESIQRAVALAAPGDTVLVFPGEYHESVYIDKDHIYLVGVIDEGSRATLNGRGVLNDAILYSGNSIVIENFEIKNYKGNAIMGQAGNNFEIRNNLIIDSGVYGIFPQLGQNGVVTHNVISGIADAAIYVGMSDNIHVAHNEVFDSVAGIEIENSRYAVVENNYVHDNTGGVLAFITPGLPIKTTEHVIIRNNFIVNNNHPNFGAPGSTVAGIPAGTGILIMAADDVVIEDNIISGNKTAGVIITDHDNAPNTTLDPESDPVPDRVVLLDNFMINNGYDTIADVQALMLTEFKTGLVDIVSVGRNRDSCILNPGRYHVVGLGDYDRCSVTTSANLANYLLAEPVQERPVEDFKLGEIAYLGVCSGCHTYNGRMIGPPVVVIQALYENNPEGLADYIANPRKIRPDYPEMPPQSYLSEETRRAVAEYMLKIDQPSH